MQDVELDLPAGADVVGATDLVSRLDGLLDALSDDADDLEADAVPAGGVLVADDARGGHGDADHAGAVGEVARQPELLGVDGRVQAERADGCARGEHAEGRDAVHGLEGRAEGLGYVVASRVAEVERGGGARWLGGEGGEGGEEDDEGGDGGGVVEEHWCVRVLG